jgi:predicted component of type VI protein secretion system
MIADFAGIFAILTAICAALYVRLSIGVQPKPQATLKLARIGLTELVQRDLDSLLFLSPWRMPKKFSWLTLSLMEYGLRLRMIVSTPSLLL